MHRRVVVSALSLSLDALVLPRRVLARSPGPRISGPFVHENLAIYLVHGASQPGKVPLTLGEALAGRKVRVIETQNVNRLEVEVLGDDAVFLQSGDIVKGGKQDRVLTSSLLLERGAGRVAVDAFCVEQGRWEQRGGEDVRNFASAGKLAPSRDTKLAIKAPPLAGGAGGRGDTALRQQQVWRSVDATQAKLSNAVGARVAAPESRSSLQLALESERLAAARAAYASALRAVGEHEPDVIGYVFAVNGRIDSGEVYAGNGLFRKMWPQLLEASANQALGGRGGPADAPPAPAAIADFMAAAESGRASRRALPANVALETRDGEAALFAEAATRAKGWFHRSYVAK